MWTDAGLISALLCRVSLLNDCQGGVRVREEAQKEQTKPIRAAKKVSNLALLPFGAAGKY